MKQERRILVPLDGSGLAEQALAAALEISKELNARIVVIRANVIGSDIGDDDSSSMTPFQEMLESENLWNQKYLDSIVEAHPEHNLEAVVLDGIGGMITYAKEKAFDLIVISSKGETGFMRWWLGSVAERLVRHSECSVLVIRGNQELTKPVPPRLFGRVLVPLDGSHLGERALKAAGTFSRNGLVLFQCLASPGLKEMLAPARYQELVECQLRTAHQYLEATAQGFPDQEVECAVGRGRVATQIVDEATRRKVDLIVMTTHGRGEQPWFLGSVAEAVLKESKVPVLVVRVKAGEDSLA